MLSCYEPLLRRPRLKRRIVKHSNSGKEFENSVSTDNIQPYSSYPKVTENSQSYSEMTPARSTPTFFDSTTSSLGRASSQSSNFLVDVQRCDPSTSSTTLTDEYCSSVRLAYTKSLLRHKDKRCDSESSDFDSHINMRQNKGVACIRHDPLHGSTSENFEDEPEEYLLDDFDSDTEWNSVQTLYEANYGGERQPNILSTIDSNLILDCNLAAERTGQACEETDTSDESNYIQSPSSDVNNIRATSLHFPANKLIIDSNSKMKPGGLDNQKIALTTNKTSRHKFDELNLLVGKYTSDKIETVHATPNLGNKNGILKNKSSEQSLKIQDCDIVFDKILKRPLKAQNRLHDTKSLCEVSNIKVNAKMSVAEKESLANLPRYCYRGCCCLSSLPNLSDKANNSYNHRNESSSQFQKHPHKLEKIPHWISTATPRSPIASKYCLPSLETPIVPPAFMSTKDGIFNQRNFKEANDEKEPSTKTISNECCHLTTKPKIKLPFSLRNDKCLFKSERTLRKKKPGSKTISSKSSSSFPTNAWHVSNKSTKSKALFNYGFSIRNGLSSASSLSPRLGHGKSTESCTTFENSAEDSHDSIADTSMTQDSLAGASTSASSLFSCLCSSTTHRYEALNHCQVILQNVPSTLHAHTFRSLNHPVSRFKSSPCSQAAFKNKLSFAKSAVLPQSSISSSAKHSESLKVISSSADEPFELHPTTLDPLEKSTVHSALASDILQNFQHNLPQEIRKTISSYPCLKQLESVMLLCGDRKCLSPHVHSNDASLLFTEQNCFLKGKFNDLVPIQI